MGLFHTSHWHQSHPSEIVSALRAGTFFFLLLVASDQVTVAQENLLPVFHFSRLPAGLYTNGMRSRVVRDEKGYVWLGTANGLERYDGYGFKDYRHIPDDPHSLSSNAIWSLLIDRKNRLWVGTFESGLSLYDPLHDRFVNFLPHPGDSSWLQNKGVLAIFEDHSGGIWLGLEFGGVVRLEVPANPDVNDPDSLARIIRFRTYSLATPRNIARDLFERDDGKILVASDSGLIVIDPGSGGLSRQRLVDPIGRRLDTLSIYCTTRDRNGNLWVGSGKDGLFKVEPKSGRVLNFTHRENDRLSLSSNWVNDIVEDRTGNIWIATISGLHLYSPVTEHLVPYLTYDRAPHLSMTNSLAVDRTGTVWVSTGEDGLYWLNPKSQRFPNFSIDDGRGSPRMFETIERANDGTYWCSSLGHIFQIDIASQRTVRSIDVFRGKTQSFWEPNNSATMIDRRGDFWYGAWGLGLYRINLATGKVNNYRYESSALNDPIVASIAQGEKDSIWIAAYREGMLTFDPAPGLFSMLPVAKLAFPFDVMKDRDGRIWSASERSGVYVYDPVTGTTEHFVHDPSDARSLSSDRAVKTYQDPSGRIWIGAGTVINLWVPATRSFARYPNPAFQEAIFAEPIGSDRKGRLWVTYQSGGLSILDPARGEFTDFDGSDGICGYVIDMENLDDGRILLAGGTGLNIVNPDSLEVQRPSPPLLITRMAINDISVPVPLPLSMGGTVPLQLSHAQNVLEFEYAAIDIDAPELVQYRYQLEGLESDWVNPQDRRYVRYPGLPPGDYTFKVRATNSRGEWAPEEIALAITILPPWWRTPWAYAAYGLFMIGLLYAVYRVRMRQVHLQEEVRMEHFQREHLAEVDRLKSRFFANISHEFRTPLTLILGPVQKWRERSREEDEKKDLSVAERNAHRLLRLINQLLDLSRVEAGAMKLRASRMNIVPLVRGIAYSFESSAGMRGIALSVNVGEEEIEIYCDTEMVEKILTNLLSNAFKFTHQGGSVFVSLRAVRSNLYQTAEIASSPRQVGTPRNDKFPHEFIEIAVADSGIGIPSDQLDKVFDRFCQVDASQTREQEGSGLGLALVKELVELHHGTIQVASDVGKGTTFIVRLPLGRSHLKDDEIAEAPVGVDPTLKHATGVLGDGAGAGAPGPTAVEQTNGEKPIVLVVEDNADVRAYIKDYLVPAYQVMEARDGAEGIGKALEVIPDLIISDVMMPKKDGYEVCRTLKLDEKTSHIPVILLTAKAGPENKLEGLETGADDYLVKPFEPRELLVRVKNLIELRRRLRDRFKPSVALKPGEISVTSMDSAFLKKVMAAVERHLGDESFSVEQLGQEVGMSRSQLHRKLTALTNQSPSDFIRYMRLHRAMALLKGNAGTVAEVAYTVGFGDPSHFSRRFHEVFSVTPGEVRKGSR
jgi:signal transduction histidine kinase/DNA-binding response OmpR family regulator/ligand-binding sensor domain-containing protein